MSKSVKDIVIECIEGVMFNGNPILNTDNLVSDLQCDDIDILEMCMNIEDAFNIEIPEEDWQNKWVTVQDIIDSVIRLLKWS